VAKITEHLKTNLYVISKMVWGFRYYIRPEENGAGYIANLESY
jgi:hypothetical protein